MGSRKEQVLSSIYIDHHFQQLRVLLVTLCSYIIINHFFLRFLTDRLLRNQFIRLENLSLFFLIYYDVLT